MIQVISPLPHARSNNEHCQRVNSCDAGSMEHDGEKASEAVQMEREVYLARRRSSGVHRLSAGPREGSNTRCLETRKILPHRVLRIRRGCLTPGIQAPLFSRAVCVT